ncbi:phage virion morphogenesis protein [Escherichia coli]|uniref:phage virion morphogenesis protein n=1 Tax=Escherichia coli TaxID=562 RepID=UPI0035306F6B
MTSPAQRHMMRVSAAMTAQREAAPLRHATVYEQMLVKLAADQRTLKAIYSKELKAAKKRELLPFWLPWVNGVLEQGKGAQDDILMTVMLWRLDTGDIAGALEIARYALKYGLTMPGIRASPEQASMEFYGGKSPKIASVHQFGLSEENRKDGKKIDYPARPLLGFTGEDVQMIEEIILAHLER